MDIQRYDEINNKLNKFRNDDISTWLNMFYNCYDRANDRKNRDVINIKDFIEELYNAYLSFKEEYTEKCTLKLGNNLEYESFSETSGKRLVFKVDAKQGSNSDVPWPINSRLFITNYKGKYNAYFAGRSDLKYSLIKDEEVFDNYLNVFQKYKPLFDLFDGIGGAIFAENQRYIQISIDPADGTYINNLNGINIALFERDNGEYRYFVNLYISFTDGLKIDYSKSFMKTKKNYVDTPDVRIYDNLLNSLNVSCEELDYDLLTSIKNDNEKRR